VAFRQHHSFSGFKHVVIPCSAWQPTSSACCSTSSVSFMVTGMSKLEPYVALGVAAVWGLYGAAYFVFASRAKGQAILLDKRTAA